ncbi:MAG: response regulator [Nitrospira sp.]
MMAHHSILLIDDSAGERELFRVALAKTGLDVILFTEQNAQAALHFLKNHSDLPSLILLDWNLGAECGDGFLSRLRADPRLAPLPVVVFTTSDDPTDVTTAYAGGANGYVVKPGTFDELVQCTADICRYWMDRNRTIATVTTSC